MVHTSSWGAYDTYTCLGAYDTLLLSISIYAQVVIGWVWVWVWVGVGGWWVGGWVGCGCGWYVEVVGGHMGVRRSCWGGGGHRAYAWCIHVIGGIWYVKVVGGDYDNYTLLGSIWYVQVTWGACDTYELLGRMQYVQFVPREYDTCRVLGVYDTYRLTNIWYNKLCGCIWHIQVVGAHMMRTNCRALSHMVHTVGSCVVIHTSSDTF